MTASRRGTRRRRVGGVLLAFLATGCAHRLGTPVRQGGQAFHITGAVVHAPRGADWYAAPGDAASLTFRKDVHRGDRHTVVAVAGSMAGPTPIATAEDLARFVDRLTAQDRANPRLRIVELRSDPDVATALCQRVRFAVEDRGVPQAPGDVFLMEGWQRFCVHPESRGRLVVFVGASQRRAADLAPIALEPEVRGFLDDVAFTALP